MSGEASAKEIPRPAYFDGRGGGVDLAGACALSRNRVGQGSVWYAAADFDALSRSVLVRMWASYARLLPVFPDLPRGVEAQEREGFLFLLNHSERDCGQRSSQRK